MPRKKPVVEDPPLQEQDTITSDSETDGDYVQELVNKYASSKEAISPSQKKKGKSEKQMEHLAKARVKALEVRRGLAAKRKTEQENEKRRREEERILVQAEKLREQERRIEARLMKERVLAKKEQEQVPKRVRNKTPIPKPAKKRIVVEEDSSSEEEEEEEEVVPTKPKKKVRSSSKGRATRSREARTRKTQSAKPSARVVQRVVPERNGYSMQATIRRTIFDDIV